MTPREEPELRWHQFYLWQLFVLMFLVALACGWPQWKWYWRSTGLFYGVAISLSGLVVFIGACLVVSKSKRPAAIVSYLLVVPLPLLIGIHGTIHGLIISLCPGSHAGLFLTDVGIGVSVSLCTTLIGMAAAAPSYLVIAIGLLARLWHSDSLDSKYTGTSQTSQAGKPPE